jgi:orotate phosphoribosyltransferase-like protein
VTQEHRREALELRKQGMTYAQIGVGLQCSTSNAHKLVTTAIAEIPREAALDVRELELARLDVMQDALWLQVLKGDAVAIRAVIRIMQRRAAMLGLDAPRQTEIWGTGVPFDVDKALG